MSQSANKKIKKYLKDELQAQCTLQARWRFPWSLWPKRKKGWIIISVFPKRQWRFEFRILDQIKMKTGSATIGKR